MINLRKKTTTLKHIIKARPYITAENFKINIMYISNT
jgi:hypothetical protein